MKHIIQIIFFAIVVVVFSGCNNSNEESTEAQKDRQGTKRQVRVRGTRVFIYPPDGFVQSNTITGFENAESSVTILFMDLKSPVDSLKKDKNNNVFEVLNKEQIQISGYEAEYKEFTFWARGREMFAQSLIFGTDTNSVYIMAAGVNDSLKDEVKESFMSIYYDPSLKLKDNLWFTIGNQKTEQLKYSAEFQKNYMYAQFPEKENYKKNEFVFIVRRDFAELDTSELRGYTRQTFESTANFEYYDNIKTKHISINGIEGYESYGTGYVVGEREEKLYYLVYLAGEHHIYRLVGVATKDFEQNLSLFKTFARTFKVIGNDD